MSGLTVYVGYPIDQARLGQDLTFLIENFEIDVMDQPDGLFQVLYDPGDAFTVVMNTAGGVPKSVAKTNRMALASSDVMAAFLPAGVPTIGLVQEIERSVVAGRRVVIFTDVESFSLADYPEEHVTLLPLSQDGVQQGVAVLHAEAEAGLLRPQEDGTGPSRLPVLVGPGGRLPSRGYADDAGLDLYVRGDWIIEPGQFLDVPCNIKVELPEWTWGLITGRSSTLRSKGLLVHSGIIDPGYRGEFFAGAFNQSSKAVQVKHGERIAQFIILPNLTREFEPVSVDAIEVSPRGEQGFGSTGA